MSEYKLAPVEPTPEMIEAGGKRHSEWHANPHDHEASETVIYRAMLAAAPVPERPTKGDPMLDAVLREEAPDFRAWVETLPKNYWARYDLSACQIGWHFGWNAALEWAAKECETKAWTNRNSALLGPEMNCTDCAAAILQGRKG